MAKTASPQRVVARTNSPAAPAVTNRPASNGAATPPTDRSTRVSFYIMMGLLGLSLAFMLVLPFIV